MPAASPADKAAKNGQAERDDGLFGPGSVTWRVMGEPLMWVAGFRALYLQALHPRVMRGTWQNTAFVNPKEAWGRLVRTSEFVRVRTYGTTADVARAARRVRKLHASLRGTEPDGTQFRLDEPELLLWVHCSEAGSYAEIARRSGVPLTRDDLDAFIDEQRRAAAVVGLDPAMVPASMAELERYFAAMRPLLRATPESRQVVLRSLNPHVPMPYTPIKLIAPGITALSFATLPRWARRMYWMPGLPVTDLAVTASLRALREGASVVPPELLFLPAARAAKRRMRAQRKLELEASEAS